MPTKKDRPASWAAPYDPSSNLLAGDPSVVPKISDGIRPRKYHSIILSVCTFILVTELCERLAYYGLTGNKIIFINSFVVFLWGDADFFVDLKKKLCVLTMSSLYCLALAFVYHRLSFNFPA